MARSTSRADAVVDGTSGERFDRAAMALTGGHNALNVAAALACVAPFGLPADTIRATLRSFQGLPHRTALVAEVRGVRFYDDSKGTNVGASVTALDGLREPCAVLIAGGRDKGGSYGPLVDVLARKGRAVVLLGEAAEAIARAVGDRVPVRRAASMDDAVRAAPPPLRDRATLSCSLRPARASTCFATTSTEATNSSAPCVLSEKEAAA